MSARAWPVTAVCLALALAPGCLPWEEEDLQAVGDPVAYKQVFAGGETMCGLDRGGSMYCWGRGGPILATVRATESCSVAVGMFGVDTYECSRRPVPALQEGPFVTVALGTSHGCALDEDARLWCWGTNQLGEAGGDGDNVWEPRRVDALEDVQIAAVAAGNRRTCAVERSGALWCWGEAGTAITGKPVAEDGTSTLARSSPRRIASSSHYVGVAVGSKHACALTDAGAVECWGQDDRGQLGGAAARETCGTTPCAVSPLPVPLETKLAQLVASGNRTCGLADDGRVVCWGDGAYSQFDPQKRYVAVRAGERGICALGSMDGSEPLQVDCFGDRMPLPGQPGADATVRLESLALGGAAACGVDAGGEVWCWGENGLGQLGNGDKLSSNASAPGKVSNPYRY